MSLVATKALLPDDKTANAKLTKLHLDDGSTRDVLAIERFDRTPEGGRIHFEEFNQLLNKPNAERYDGFYSDMANFIREKSGQDDVKRLYARLLSQFLLGNTDSHFKNFAMFNDHGHWSLTPNYDLAPTGNYKIEGQRQNAVALRISRIIRKDECTLDKLDAKKLVILGKELGLSTEEIRDTVNSLLGNIEKAKEAVRNDPSEELNHPTVHRKKTYREDFCDRLDGRRQQLFAGLNKVLELAERGGNGFHQAGGGFAR